jgi:hypothetical protein
MPILRLQQAYDSTRLRLQRAFETTRRAFDQILLGSKLLPASLLVIGKRDDSQRGMSGNKVLTRGGGVRRLDEPP